MSKITAEPVFISTEVQVNAPQIGVETHEQNRIIIETVKQSIKVDSADKKVIVNSDPETSIEAVLVDNGLYGINVTELVTDVEITTPAEIVSVVERSPELNLDLERVIIEVENGQDGNGITLRTLNSMSARYGLDFTNVISNGRFIQQFTGWRFAGDIYARFDRAQPEVPANCPYQFVARLSTAWAYYAGRKLPVVPGETVYAEVSCATSVLTAKTLRLVVVFYDKDNIEVGRKTVGFRNSSAFWDRIAGEVRNTFDLGVFAEFRLELDDAANVHDPNNLWFFSDAKLMSASVSEGANARITEEITLRAEADEALAERITTLEASIGGDWASIEERFTVLTNRTQALAEYDLFLYSQFDGNIANVRETLTSLVTDNSALAQSVTNLETEFNGNISTINNTLSSIVTDTAATADAILNLETDFNGRISSAESTLSVLSNDVLTTSNAQTQLRSDFDGNIATINNQLTTLVTAQEAFTQLQTDLTATVENNRALFSGEITVLADGQSALATQVSTLSTTVGENTTAVTEFAETLNGMAASWGVQINSNGVVTGLIRLDGNLDYSQFKIAVDKLIVTDPTGVEGNAPFIIEDGVTYIKEAVIPNLTTKELFIENNGSIVVRDNADVRRVEMGRIGGLDFGLIVRKATGEVVINVDSLGLNVVGTDQLIDASVTGIKMPNDVITELKIAGEAITAAKIKLNAIDALRIADGAIVEQKISDGAISASRLFSNSIRPVEVVITLPSTGNFAGRTVFLTTDQKLYRHKGTPSGAAGFTTEVPTSDLIGQIITAQLTNGLITNEKLLDGAVSELKIASGAVTAAKTSIAAIRSDTGLLANSVVTFENIVDGAVTNTKISNGAINMDKMAPGLEVPSIVSSLPATGNYAGRLVVLSADGKLYRHLGTPSGVGGWTKEVAAADLSGVLGTGQIADGAITPIKTALAAVNNATGNLNINTVGNTQLVDGAVVADKLNNGAVNVSKLATGLSVIERLSTLPATGNYEGRTVFLTTDKKLYRHTGSPSGAAGFVASVPTSDLTGTISTLQIAEGAITAAKTNLAALSSITGNLNVNTVGSSQLVDSAVTSAKTAIAAINASTGNLNSNVVGVNQIANGAVIADKLNDGAVTLAKMASGLSVIERLSSLPSTGNFEGRTVYLTTDKKLYRYNGTVFTASVPVGDLSGQIPASGIADGAITAVKTSLAAINPGTGNLNANTVDANQIVSNAIIADKIASNAVTADKIIANAVTSDKIAANTIVASDIAANTITANEIAAHTITANQITAGTITAVEIAASAIIASKILIGDTNNLILDGNLDDPSAWALQGTAIGSDATVLNLGYSKGLIFEQGNGTPVQSLNYARTANNQRFSVEGGKDYRFSFHLYTTNSYTGRVSLFINWTKADGSISSQPNPWVGPDGRTTAIGTQNLPDISVIATAPADAVTATPYFVQNWSTTLNNNGRAYIMRPRAQRAVSGELIVDGAVTANKIQANAVTADKVVAGAITASKIVIADNSNLILDGDIQDTNYWTVSQGNPAHFSIHTLNDPAVYGTNNVLRITNTVAVTIVESQLIKVQPGEVLYAEGTVGTVGTALSGGYLRTYNANKVWLLDHALIADDTGVRSYSGQFTVPANIYYVKWMFLRRAGGTTGDIVYAGKPLIKKANGAGLIVDGAIITEKLAAGAVTALKITANTITANEIATGAITADELSANSVTSNAIVGLTITAEKIAANAITTDKLNANAVTAAKIAGSTITANEIATGTIVTGLLASGAILTDNLGAGAVTALKIAANTITANEIAAGAILADELAANAVTADKILANSVTTDKLNANAVTAAKIAGSTITANEIATGTIVTGLLAANAVTASKLFLGDTANLILDSELTDPAYWVLSGGMTLGTDATPTALGYSTAMMSPAGNGTTSQGLSLAYIAYPQAFNVKAGKQYRLTYHMYSTSGFTGYHRMWINWLNGVGTVISQPNVYNGPDGRTVALGTQNIEVSILITAPVNAVKCSIYFQCGWSTTLNNNGRIFFMRPRVQLAMDAELIVDGAITTDKLNASAVTADKIAANAITANKLDANAITAEKLSVGIFSDNLVLNGGAETGTTEGWIHFNSVGSTPSSLTTSIATASEGRWSFMIPPGGAGSSRGVISKAIAVKRSMTYSWKISVSGAAAQPNGLNVRMYQRNNKPISSYITETGGDSFDSFTTLLDNVPIPGAYTHYSGTYTVPSTVGYIGLYVSNGTGTTVNLYFDDVEIKRQSQAVNIQDGAISADKIEANAVTAVKILAGAVIADKIATDAVTADKILANAVTAVKINTNAVTADKILANAVTAVKINALAVESDKINALAVTSDKVAANAITAGKINAGAVGANEIAANAITATKLFIGDTNNLITDGDLRDPAAWNLTGGMTIITASDDTTLAAANFRSAFRSPVGNGTTSQAASAVTGVTNHRAVVEGAKRYRVSCSVRIPAGFTGYVFIAIRWINQAGTNLSAPGPFEDYRTVANPTTKIVNLNQIIQAPSNAYYCWAHIGVNWSSTLPNSGQAWFAAPRITKAVEGEMIVDGTITTTHLAANSVTATQILAGSITSNELAANAITAIKIAAGAVTSDKITVNNLAAISANLGAITAGSLNINNRFIVAADGVTTIKSAATGARIELDNSQFRVYDASGNLRLRMGVW